MQYKSTLLLFQCVGTYCQQCSSRQCLCNSMPRDYLKIKVQRADSYQHIQFTVDPSPVKEDPPVLGADQSLDDEQMRLFVQDANDHATLIHDESSALWAAPSAVKAQSPVWGVPLFTAEQS